MDLMLNVAFGISFNNSTPFVDYIRVHNEDKCNLKYEFEFNDREIQYHPIVKSNLKTKKSKKKDEVYVCLIGDDLKSYFDLVNQKFKFNEKELWAIGEDFLKYLCKFDPKSFILQFEQKHKRLDDVSKIIKLIDSVPDDDKDVFKKNLALSYEEFVSFFYTHFAKKHIDHGKSLFIFCCNKDLVKLISKKIEYFNYFSKSTNFEDALVQIKFFLNVKQVDFIDKHNPIDFSQLLKVANIFNDLIAVDKTAQGSITAAPIFSTIGMVLVDYDDNLPDLSTHNLKSSFYATSENSCLMESDQTENDLMNLNTDSYPESWMNELHKKLNVDNTRNDLKIVTNTEFKNNPEAIVEQTKGYSVISLLSSISKNLSGFQLQTNKIDSTNEKLDSISINPQTSPSIDKKSQQAAEESQTNDLNKFKKQEFVLKEGLPVIKFKESYNIEKYYKTTPEKKRKRNLEHSFVTPSTSRTKYSLFFKKNKKN